MLCTIPNYKTLSKNSFIVSPRNTITPYVTFQYIFIQCVPLATEPGISIIILPLMRILHTKFEADLPHCVRNVRHQNICWKWPTFASRQD